MKKLTMKAVMNSLSIVTHKDGYELISVAGRARYDAWGVRKFLIGIPEYFPITISVTGGNSTAPSSSDADTSKAGKPGLGGLLDMQNSIADQLDHLKGAWDQVLGRSSEGKVPVVMLGGRYTAIGGGYTPEEISAAVEHIKHRRLTKELGKELADLSPFAIKDGEVFIQDAFIGNGITSANWSMKINTDENGHRYAAGMGVAVEDGKEQAAFKADRFAVTAAAQSIIENAQAIMTDASITATELKPRLSDEMRDAVIDAIRESDVFKALLVSQDTHASALVAMQQAIEQTATDAIRNALKPGGLLHRGI